MRLFTLFISTLAFVVQALAGPSQYDSLAQRAKTFFDKGDYPNAVIEYRAACNILQGLLEDDRYYNGVAWAALGNKDSAFYNLYRLQQRTEYLVPHLLLTEKRFDILHTDPRWTELLGLINPRNEVYNDSLAKVLEAVYETDQMYRVKVDSIAEMYGRDSEEFNDLWRAIQVQDVLDEVVVFAILEKYGWLSKVEVGTRGSATIWLVIQHANLEAQQKYFPIMAAAVQKGKASKMYLAYLNDRILMRQGKNQLYGTQYKVDNTTGLSTLWPIETPDSLNIRRAAMGLSPLKLNSK